MVSALSARAPACSPVGVGLSVGLSWLARVVAHLTPWRGRSTLAACPVAATIPEADRVLTQVVDFLR